MVLPPSFYSQPDVVYLARQLLGKVLVTGIGSSQTAGIIVETEAYAGVTDQASHAYGGRRTDRTEAMYQAGGTAYVYLCYGIHYLFNVVTNQPGVPHAVLVRALEPIEGVGTMLARRGMAGLTPRLTAGPGALTKAMGITGQHNRLSLQSSQLRIEDRSITIAEQDIVASTRVGVAYAGEDALLPYRFSIMGNAFISKAKGL